MAWLNAKINNIPPGVIMKEITIPSKLAPLVQAFAVDSEKVTKALVIEAARAIYGNDEEEEFDFSLCKKHEITNDEIENICALIKGLNPKDTLESLYAAQIVASHMLGMRKLAKSHITDQQLGLKILRFSLDSMQQLQKKRNGSGQNITVNYNYHGQGNALMQTVIPT